MVASDIKACLFDVFGTVVDWRTSIIRDGEAFGRRKGLGGGLGEFADAWRGLYQPSMDEVRSGAPPWTRLDDLHRRASTLLRATSNHGASAGGDRRTSTAPGIGSIRGRTSVPGSRG